MSAESQRTCPSCGNELSEAMEFCPVCMLRKGLAGAAESSASSSGDILRPIPDQPAQRFEHYELVVGEDGKPVELGRGAMGVTYKAVDINLRCPVTLKVISMFRSISQDPRRQASTDAADLLDAILRTNSYDNRELATELGWTRKKIRNVRTVLGSYIKHRAKSHPELRRLTLIVGEAAERLCEKYAVLNLLLSGNFLPTRRSKSLVAIYEKFESLPD